MNPFWKVELSFASFESKSGFVISKCSFLGSLESSKPNPCCLLRISNLRGPFPPWPVPNPFVVSSYHCYIHIHIIKSQEEV
ncbi:hypothetical protein Ahy_B03g063869 [Arachis hypogaea]|uniref:Uncharacterized protein n=1 Tax=Arachis hypogaea TaxID=3818 RepID=A0A444ZY99_ARAHY|nr:hypothetical protein Ahy_B03g063869 [Arachis hypogaea]